MSKTSCYENNESLNVETSLKKSEAFNEYNKFTQRKILFIVGIIVTIMLVSILDITFGALKISFSEVCSTICNRFIPSVFSVPNELTQKVVWNIRLPRLIMGFMTGFNLAIAGAVMQPILRNPMASPFTLGISSGAGFGATIAIIFGESLMQGPYFIVANAFIFAVLTSLIVLGISKFKGATPEIMILAGVALSQLFGAGTTLMKYFADTNALSEIVFWMVGSLSKATWQNIGLIFPVSLCCIPFLIIKSWDLNLMSAGDEVAKSLGTNVDRTRFILLVITSLLTAVTICFTGTIGFIGLLAPHITRMIIGGDNRFVIPTSGLIGALLLIAADVVATNIIAPVILPIGVVTAIMGAPMFIYLIIKRRKVSC